LFASVRIFNNSALRYRTGGRKPSGMIYQIFTVRMPDPRAAGVPSSTGPSSGPELINGRFHVISNKGRKINNSLAKLAGPGVKILGLESQREFTQDEVRNLGPESKRQLRNRGYITALLPDYSTEQPFQN
jgi:hypothetical protein